MEHNECLNQIRCLPAVRGIRRRDHDRADRQQSPGSANPPGVLISTTEGTEERRGKIHLPQRARRITKENSVTVVFLRALCGKAFGFLCVSVSSVVRKVYW